MTHNASVNWVISDSQRAITLFTDDNFSLDHREHHRLTLSSCISSTDLAILVQITKQRSDEHKLQSKIHVNMIQRTKRIKVNHYIMAGRACVVAKEVFIIETVVFWHWDNGWMTEKQLFRCKFSYVSNHLYSLINFNHVKLKYIEPCNFLTKRA